MDVYFLKAARPLCKAFTQNADGTIHKSAYPMVKNFTSFKETPKTIGAFYELVKQHAAEGHCLIKGVLKRDLIDESRQNTTDTDATTQWVCLDFDRLNTKTDLDEALRLMGLADVSYIKQYSASQGLAGTENTLSAHVFMCLEAPLPAPSLKAWLIEQNLTHFKDDLVLQRTKIALHYPLDISACQNDKLIYIAPPVFKAPLTDPIPERLALVRKPLDTIPAGRIEPKHIEVLKKDEREILNTLRGVEGLPKRTATTKYLNGVEVMQKPDECMVTGIKVCGEYTRLNINGGDSWAYWHYTNKFDLIYDYKTGMAYRTQEFVPGYYKQCLEKRRAENMAATKEGDLILAFRDLETALYYNGHYNAKDDVVQLYPAKNEKQLHDWMEIHGRELDKVIPVWRIMYDPHKNDEGKYWHLNRAEHKINQFNPSKYMETPARTEKGALGDMLITNIMRHALGVTKDNDPNYLFLHFFNWFASIFQRKERPLTAWVLHGIEGTGKGVLFNKVFKPLLGDENVISITTRDLRDNFNSFLENKLMVFVDEVDVDDFGEKGLVSAKLRNAITEPTIAIRPMRQVTKQVTNTLSFVFASNRPQPVFIPPTDRRYNVGEFQSEKISKKLFPFNVNSIAGELERFAAVLNGWQVDLGILNTICQSQARADIQQASVSSYERVAMDIKEGNFEAFWAELPNSKWQTEIADIGGVRSAYKKLLRDIAEEDIIKGDGISRLTRDDLYVLFEYLIGNVNPAGAKFGRVLALNGLKPILIKHKGEVFRGIRIQWQISQDLRTEIGNVLKDI